MSLEVIVTCEHGGNRIPKEYREFFAGAEAVLEGHRGWDAGSLALARKLSEALEAPLYFSTTSRLLIDLNRSPGHPRWFSEYSRRLSPARREGVVETCYAPYRSQVAEAIGVFVREGKTVLHVSVHSFTSLFAGKERTTDLGLLYDPQRETESRFVELWRRELQQHSTKNLKVHRNQPYRGTSDGLTTSLRKHYQPEQYLGIELELSDKWLTAKARFPGWIEKHLVESLHAAIRMW